ncbi:D-lactate ferricytochrome c oxidoreductase [Friedmanniomyces endolithicus]|uniref:D-lactate dehydrogenase (cytochrome) n=1 Tax=Friedmanniomyces endolithicus TaxID=329885 RepID=A0AAN6KN77_9PEZI|nr:D-lactate ferricytochrome c oxidoreductase [Friedmanniomyces endolithicus]KAK0992659.1 D-lactate ferricytochrome c oxidoreductase [Friedmanniomyces endolithicus]KAK1001884.1 D-lactate ferricytochrome c oxidoreductase [Friedmanniomyces endolithicus]KAK1040713.1 D-lactate ferricytochrome c oxidoreductase [Friedmanniomyces endolithicus]
MPPLHRTLPALRRLRLANASFQQPAHLRLRPAAPPLRTLHSSPRARQEEEKVSPTTSASSADHAPQDAPDRPQSKIKYTSDSYPDLKRDSRFKKVSKEDVEHFKKILGSEAAILDGVTNETGEEDFEQYNSDWMRKYRGQCRLVLKPETTEQVSGVLKYCNEQSLAVVPQGGNSGLVGGSVPVFDEIVINLSRLNKVRSFDDVSGVLVADAGVILQQADEYVGKQNHIFPLDLGAKGTCQIGANVATNAGGLRLLRYGSMHGNILGLECVLPDGTIMDDLSKLRKNNTGYDLKQLFIGGEGTIGIITAISILCPQRSSAINVAYFGLESYEKVMEAFKEAKKQLGEILSAFELMDRQSQSLYHQAKHVMSEEIVSDGVVAESETQLQSLWACREGISEAGQHWGGVYKYDLSIPLPELYSLVEDARKMFESNGLMHTEDEKFPVKDVVGYGHMGDSNLHLNVATRRYDKEVERALEPWVYEWVAKRQGSISAEHGLGLAKKAFIGYSRSETMIRLMGKIKETFDPVSGSVGFGVSCCEGIVAYADGLVCLQKGIMNPYKYI